jgi:uncharacterized FlaG/YvyC family protein
MSDYRIITSVDSGNYSPAVNSGGSGAVRTQVQAQDAAYSLPGGKPQPAVEQNTQALAVQQAKPPQKQEKPAPKEADKAALPITNISDVFLRFKVDEDTSNITVYVIDRETRRVLRSIPPEEMNKIQAGDLLELLA